MRGRAILWLAAVILSGILVFAVGSGGLSLASAQTAKRSSVCYPCIAELRCATTGPRLRLPLLNQKEPCRECSRRSGASVWS